MVSLLYWILNKNPLPQRNLDPEMQMPSKKQNQLRQKQRNLLISKFDRYNSLKLISGKHWIPKLHIDLKLLSNEKQTKGL